MDQIITYVLLFITLVTLGQLFQRSTIPLALILVIFGMVLSFIPYLPEIKLDSNLVLNCFLPLLVYQISAFSSWRDIKKQIRPIASLSIGHVIFITLLVAVVIHTFIPQMGWPLAFVLGAIVSPPDDVAIVSICEKIRMPERIFIILEGEGMFNDAAALILFRFALAAAITHKFSAMHAFSAFVAVVIGEMIYGLILGNLLGKIRLTITNTTLHLIASLMTPFLAYIPVVLLGGTGVLATAVVGFVIGNYYSIRTTPEYRLISTGIWPTLAFAIEGLIFLLVGLDMRSILMRISIIPIGTLMLYVFSITVVVIVVGRFIWVFGSVIFNSKLLFPKRTNKTSPTWRNTFVIAWAGMRGGISLAAAFAMPALIFNVDGIDIRDLLIFIVFCLIIVTLVVQGLSLPFILRKLGIDQIGQSERYMEHLSELEARAQMIHVALSWLKQYRKEIKDNKKLLDEVDFHIHEYQTLENKYRERILDHHGTKYHDEKIETKDSVFILLQLVKIEKNELLRLWRDEKINLRTRNKLLSLLDHQIQHFII